MSNILSYSNKTAHTGEEDWIAVEPYTDDDIQRIKDPDGGLSRNPRTAIPSPFAQLDLVKNAFTALSNPYLRGAAMNERLVSNALDVAQLLFDFENHKDYLRLVRWNREEQLAQLKASGQHRLYGETLELFLAADKVYNFDDLHDWYILLWGSQVVGGTSPASLVMAAPVSAPIDAIKVEQGVPLFSTDRPLWKRDDEFVYYMYLLFNAYPVLREKVGMVYSYMLHNLEYLRRERTALYQRITQVIPNPNALDRERAAAVLEVLEHTYDRFNGAADVSVLGARFYHKRVADIRTSASESDFVIQPTMPQPAGKTLPLVLCNGFNGSVEHYRYIDREWDSATEVLAGTVPMEQRKLPDTSIQYPFLTTADLLTDSILRVSNAIDGNHFFDGNIKSKDPEPTKGYLLPLKPEFFRWFTADDLKRHVVGRNMLDIEEASDGSVLVTLRIPVKKRHIELTRRYYPTTDHTWTFDERRGTGRVVDAIMSAAVFPFVRTERNDDYTVQLFSMLGDGSASLRFLRNGGDTSKIVVTQKQRAHTVYTTEYYDVNGTWDYAEATVHNNLGTFTGIILPMWKPYTPSAQELIFAIDFGTTNTHVEWAERGQMSQPLTFASGTEQVLVASLLKQGGLDIAEQLQRIEFLPHDIDSLYGFPLRSALASNTGNDGGRRLFHDVNIPFLYERKFFDGYDVTTGLKWMNNNILAKEFLRELTLLIKAKALLENVDLRNVQVVYFYPVSMGGSDRRQLQDTWEDLYRTYIGDDIENRLQSYPESVAPAFYYKSADVTGSSYVSIDIGGGTSDTVIYQPSANGMRSEPVAISSFRFAGNAIFGDAFGDRDADNNPLLQHYTRYFQQIIENDRSAGISYLTSIMQDIMRGKRSEDINAFLFSIENVEELRDLREIDRNLYSYNVLLRNDGQRKLVFMYFYAAIIYYIARAMQARGFVMPKQIYFSGTGSKILNILGSRSLVTEFTQIIIERVFGKPYSERFEIKIETECPKQITCRGGIKLENQRLDKETDVSLYSARSVNAMKYCYSMLGPDQLTYGDMNDPAKRTAIVEQVKEFNRFFIDLCDKVTKDEFGIENGVFQLFCSVLNDDVTNYLTAGINAFLQGRYESSDVVEDVPFFYPVVGVIRYNLLKNLTNEVISKYKPMN
ncbi:MAG: hypothetical protein IJ775_05340 [Muribaculaceae bacterium]|nr:hypothetical protein [Muribaculaceae bacterium]